MWGGVMGGEREGEEEMRRENRKGRDERARGRE